MTMYIIGLLATVNDLVKCVYPVFRLKYSTRFCIYNCSQVFSSVIFKMDQDYIPYPGAHPCLFNTSDVLGMFYMNNKRISYKLIWYGSTQGS